MTVTACANAAGAPAAPCCMADIQCIPVLVAVVEPVASAAPKLPGTGASLPPLPKPPKPPTLRRAISAAVVAVGVDAGVGAALVPVVVVGALVGGDSAWHTYQAGPKTVRRGKQVTVRDESNSGGKWHVPRPGSAAMLRKHGRGRLVFGGTLWLRDGGCCDEDNDDDDAGSAIMP